MAHQTPKELGPEGAKLWKTMVKGITYRPDELRILTNACRMADRIARLEEDFQGQPSTVKGSMGQIVIHPLLAEITALEVKQAGLLARLDVPGDEEEDETVTKMTTSQAARKAARSRWSKSRGA